MVNRTGRWALLLGLGAAVAGGLWNAATAQAVSVRSQNVALIPSDAPDNAGVLQTSGTVEGADGDSFDGFSFTNVDETSIDAATLSQFDTVVLDEVNTSDLDAGQRQALSDFVTSGGKLIIHDADATDGNDYSWLPVPASTGQSCQNCGNVDGVATVVESSTLVSNDPASPFYVNVDELPGNTDAVGDANVLLTDDPRWDVTMRATNSQNVDGAVGAYAQAGGLIVYNGYDTDGNGSALPSGVNWLQKMWYQELAQQWNPDNLPHSTPATSGGGGPVVNCGREAIKIGVVSVCADQISGSGADMSASGHVVLDAGVSVGDGPIALDQVDGQISTGGSVPVTLLRRGGSLSLGSASFTIDTGAATDPTSGKGGLAKVRLDAIDFGVLGSLRVGGLPFQMPVGAGATMYLDSAFDGGLVGSASLQLPLLGKLESSGALSLGLYAGSRNPVVALGGAVHLGSVELGKGWGFEGLDLTYREPTDTWTASGGLGVPIGSLHASGALIGGRLDALSVSIGNQTIPLGDSGFFFTDFGGGVSGLVRGPLKLSAMTGGYWGVPKLPVEPFYLKDVTFTLDFSGSASLHGEVAFLLKDHSPVHGRIDLKVGIRPFYASGRVTVDADLPTVSLGVDAGAGFNPKHFTVQGKGKLSVALLHGDGTVVASDLGLGASGKLCALFVCTSTGFAGTWSQLDSLAHGNLDALDVIGADPGKLVTVQVAAAGRAQVVDVPRGRLFLLVSARGPGGPPTLVLRAPNGRIFRTDRPHAPMLVGRQPRYRLTSVVIVHPRPGRWRVVDVSGRRGTLRLESRTLHPVTLIHAVAHVPRTSARHRLVNPHRRLTMRWRSHGLPAGVVVSIVDSRARRGGLVLAGHRRANGRASVTVAQLARGRSTLTLLATLHGAPFQRITLATAWRAGAPQRRHAHRRRRR